MKKIFLFITTILYCTLIYGIPVDPTPFEYTQPDGSKLTLRGYGDEYYTWTEAAGNILIKNDKGFYEYATIADNEIVASGVLFNPRANAQVRAANNIASREEIMELIAAKRQALIAELDSIAHAEEEVIDEEPTVARKAAGPARAAKPKQSLTQGKQKVLCIMIDFSDRQFKKKPADFANMWNGTNYYVRDSYGTETHGSVREFYEENSYGNMSVQAEVFGPYRAKKTSSYYKGTVGSKNVQALVTEALEAFKKDKKAKKFKDFDVNDDHYVDCVHIIYAGYAADYDGSTIGLIQSHASVLKTSVMQGAAPIYYAKRYMITSELAGKDSKKEDIAPIGTVCHEYGHILGAPDFYDTDYSTNGQFYGTGQWDVMASGCDNQNGRCPAHHNPYTKAYIYNWVKPMVITPSVKNTMYKIAPSATTASFYRININETGEFFLVENKEHVGFNRGIMFYDHCGLLIYHVINEDLSEYISSNTINNSFPQKCYIVNSSATQDPDFRDYTSYGTLSDEYAWGYPSTRVFDKYNYFFTATSTPSATTFLASINPNFNYTTGVDLCFIRGNLGDGYMSFVVNPQIEGLETLSNTGFYEIQGVTPDALIEWSYSYKPNQMINPGPGSTIVGEPITITPCNANGIVKITRGKYVIIDDSGTSFKIKPLREYNYNGTVTLKATITCYDYTYVMTKNITLADAQNIITDIKNNNTPARSAAHSDKETEIETQEMQEENTSYRLVYVNPVLNSAEIRVEKLENGVYIPFEGEYTLSLWGDRVGVSHQSAKNQSTCTFDCSGIPMGVYQLVLQVNGKVAASSKMLKLL